MADVGQLWVKLGLDSSNFDSGLSKAEKKSQGFGSRVKSFLGGAFQTAVGVAMERLGELGVSAVKTGIATVASFEQYKSILATVLGSQEKAAEQFQWIMNFAKKTPFEVPGLVEATVRLAAYGIDAKEVLQTLGDTAAAMGKDVMQAVEALADAQTGEFERLKEFGVKAVEVTKSNAAQLGLTAEAVGKTALLYTDKYGKQQVALVDRNNREMITSTLMAIWNERYAGAMEKQSQTLVGMWSNLKDNITMILYELMQNFEPILKNILSRALDFLDRFREGLEAGGIKGAIEASFGPGVWAVINTFINIIQGAWNILVGVYNFIVNNWSWLGPIIIGVASSFMAFKAITFVQDTISKITASLEMARYSFTLFKMGLRDTPSLIGKVVKGFSMLLGVNPTILAVVAVIGALVAIGYVVYQNWDTIKEFLITTWETIKTAAITAWNAIAEFFSSVWTSIVTAATTIWTGIATFFTTIWEGIKNTAITIWNGIIQFFTVTVPAAFMTLVNWFAALPGRIVQFLAQLPETIAYWIGYAVGTAIKLVSTGITNIINWFASLPGRIAAFVTNVYTTVVQWFTNAKNAAVNLVTNLINGVVSFFSTLPGRIAAFVMNAYNAIVRWFTNAKNTAINLATGLVNGVVSFFTSLPGRIATIVTNFKNAIVNGFNAAKSWAVSAANNLVNGVRSAISAIPGIFTTIWSNVISFVSSLPGKLWQKAKSIASSFWEGFKKGLGIHSPSYVEEAFFAIAGAAKESVAATTRAVQGINRQLQPNITPFGTIPTGIFGSSEGAGGTVIQGPLVQVQSMSVRSDDDIRQISRGLYDLIQTSTRAKGVVLPTTS